MTRILAAGIGSVLLAACLATSLGAQGIGSLASIHGQVAVVPGAISLPGVTVTLTTDTGGPTIASAVTGPDGTFTFPRLAPGVYRVRAALSGFDDVTRDHIVLATGARVEVALDFPLGFSTNAEAVTSLIEAPATGASEQTIEGRMIDVVPVRGDNYDALLPTLPGVLRGPDGRLNVNGGRPAATGLQINQTSATDPVTGDAGIDLPIDAVATLDVQPNPYAAEYGRFSAGIVRIETQKGGDTWNATANNFIPVPCLKICDGANWGVRSYDPRLLLSGPLVAHKVFLAESVQLHDHDDRVPSLPPISQNTSVKGLESFTRVDATLGRHTVTGSLAVSDQALGFVGLSTFTPQPVTPNIHRGGYNGTVDDTLRFSDTSFLESVVTRAGNDTVVAPQTNGVMILTPGGTEGSFFNQQTRHAQTTEWNETLSAVGHADGDHLLKVGVDVLQASFDGTSQSAPVDVQREDGTLAESLVYSGPTAEHGDSASLGAFLQDRWRVNDRVLIELGARVDRDGVTRQVTGSPRAGFVLGVLPRGRGIVRGGAGIFADRTPLLAGAFASIEAPTVTTFAADGVTPTGPPVTFVNRIDGPLRTPTALTWNLEYDHRVGARVVLKFNHLERRGSDELVVNPVESGTTGTLDLESTGESRYDETEATVRYADASKRELVLSYVRSASDGDLNPFDTYFGNIRSPIIQSDVYGVTNADVPNRLIVRATLPRGKWMIAPLVEVRNGFPFSVIDEDQNFVGLRNTDRFPVFWTVDLTISRLIKFHGRTLRIGARGNNLLNAATPRDVQANIDSPAFGTFYNPLVRQIGLTIEIQH